jgi:hypothetical protein
VGTPRFCDKSSEEAEACVNTTGVASTTDKVEKPAKDQRVEGEDEVNSEENRPRESRPTSIEGLSGCIPSSPCGEARLRLSPVPVELDWLVDRLRLTPQPQKSNGPSISINRE